MCSLILKESGLGPYEIVHNLHLLVLQFIPVFFVNTSVLHLHSNYLRRVAYLACHVIVVILQVLDRSVLAVVDGVNEQVAHWLSTMKRSISRIFLEFLSVILGTVIVTLIKALWRLSYLSLLHVDDVRE